MFLVPMIVLMLVQSSIILGIIVFRGVIGAIQEASVETLQKDVENHRSQMEGQMLRLMSSGWETQEFRKEVPLTFQI